MRRISSAASQQTSEVNIRDSTALEMGACQDSCHANRKGLRQDALHYAFEFSLLIRDSLFA